MSLATSEPLSFNAGDTVKWQKSFADYPVTDGWILTYALRGASVINITASVSEHHYLISLSSDVTADYVTGTYWWQAYISKLDERYPVGSGQLTIKPNLSAVSGTYDNRTHVKKTLDALEAVIENRATLDQKSYSIAGRSLERMSVDDLIKWRNEYRRQYKAEQNQELIARGLPTKKLIKIRFK